MQIVIKNKKLAIEKDHLNRKMEKCNNFSIQSLGLSGERAAFDGWREKLVSAVEGRDWLRGLRKALFSLTVCVCEMRCDS